jgi:hypothetical protein
MPRARSVCSHNTPVPCGSPAVRGGRCAVHAAQQDAARGDRHARGYGKAHAVARARLLRRWALARAKGIPWLCPRCGGLLVPGQPIDADHYRTQPPDPPDRLAHAACNRAKRTVDEP